MRKTRWITETEAVGCRQALKDCPSSFLCEEEEAIQAEEQKDGTLGDNPQPKTWSFSVALSSCQLRALPSRKCPDYN